MYKLHCEHYQRRAEQERQRMREYALRWRYSGNKMDLCEAITSRDQAYFAYSVIQTLVRNLLRDGK